MADHRLPHWFAEGMREMLMRNRGKNHWSGSSSEWLVSELLKNAARIVRNLALGEPIGELCFNVANFAMMVADNEKGSIHEEMLPPHYLVDKEAQAGNRGRM